MLTLTLTLSERNCIAMAPSKVQSSLGLCKRTRPIVGFDAKPSIGMPPPDGQRTDGRKSMGVPLPEMCMPGCDLDL